MFNLDAVRIPYKELGKGGFTGLSDEDHAKRIEKGKIPETWWAQDRGNGLCVVARLHKERVNYPTQKPLALLKRIVLASSNEGDTVLDAFCGSGTACVAAYMLKRNFIGIDKHWRACDSTAWRLEQLSGRPHKTDTSFVVNK